MAIIKCIVSVLLIIGPAFYFGFTGNNATMGLAIIAGSIASAFIHLDKFQEFKGAGFEAKLRDSVRKAEVTLEQITQLVKYLAISMVKMKTHTNMRFMSGRDMMDESAMEEIIKLVNMIELAHDDEVRTTIIGYYYCKAKELYHIASYRIKYVKDKHEANAKLIQDNFPEYTPDCVLPKRDDFLKVMEDNGIEPDERLHLHLDNYEEFIGQYKNNLRGDITNIKSS